MKKLMVLIVLFAGVSFAQTATPEARMSAERLLQVLKMAENYDNSIRQAVQMQRGLIDQMDIPADQKDTARSAMNRSMKTVMEQFSWERMKGMFVDIYAEVFSAEELNGVIAFYESPAGQKFVEKQPLLTQVTMQKMQALMSEMMPALQKEAEKIAEQLKEQKAAEASAE